MQILLREPSTCLEYLELLVFIVLGFYKNDQEFWYLVYLGMVKRKRAQTRKEFWDVLNFEMSFKGKPVNA